MSAYELPIGGATAAAMTAVGVVAASSVGTLLTPPGSANTKSSPWTEIVASTAAASDGFLLTALPGDVGIADFLFDIGTGGSGSETVLIANVAFTSGSSDAGGARAYFPIPIPASTRIAARIQSSDTSAAAVRIILELCVGGIVSSLRRSYATTYGADTGDSGGVAVDAGASTNTKGAWSEISASVTDSFDSCFVTVGQRNNAANTSQNILMDLGVGASLSEVVIVPDLYTRVTAAEEVIPKWTWVPIEVQAGQRLAARIQSTSNDATDRIVDVTVIGFT